MQSVQYSFQVKTYDIDLAGIVSNYSYIRRLENLRNLFVKQSSVFIALETLRPVRLPEEYRV